MSYLKSYKISWVSKLKLTFVSFYNPDELLVHLHLKCMLASSNLPKSMFYHEKWYVLFHNTTVNSDLTVLLPKAQRTFFSIVSFDYDHAKTNTFGVFWNHRIKQRTFYSWMSEIKCILESNRWNAIANSITNENNNTWQICINFFNQREARKKNSKSPLRHLNVLDRELG